MTTRFGERAKELRSKLEATGRYGPCEALDPHDGSVQAMVEGLIVEALIAAVENECSGGVCGRGTTGRVRQHPECDCLLMIPPPTTPCQACGRTWARARGEDDTMNDPTKTEVLAERVKFDIIGKTESGHELRVWTDGDRVVWQDDEGRSGYMPAMLFRVAAHMLADYCEEKAIQAGEDGDTFYAMVHDSLRTPVTLAMAHPYWAQPDHEANDLRFGFSSIATNMALDEQPNGLRPRGWKEAP